MPSAHMTTTQDSVGFLSNLFWRKTGFVLLIAVVVVLGYLIFQRYLRIPTTMLLLSFMLTFLLQPLVEWLTRVSRIKNQHSARVLATLLLYLLFAAAIYGVGAGIASSLKGSTHELQITWQRAQQHLPQQLLTLQRWYQQTIPDSVKDQIQLSVKRQTDELSQKYVPTVVATIFEVSKKAITALGLLVEMIVVPLIAFYLLTDAPKVREQLLFFVPEQRRKSLLRYTAALGSILRSYIQGQLLLCAIAWIVVTIGLLALKVPGALLLGIIAGVSRGIPIVGPVIGGIPILGATLLVPHLAGAFWWVLIGFTALHFAESKFLMPRILGDQLGIHPVIIIISLLIGYELLGFLGMFLAPPTVAMIRFVITLHRSEATNNQKHLVAT